MSPQTQRAWNNNSARHRQSIDILFTSCGLPLQTAVLRSGPAWLTVAIQLKWLLGGGRKRKQGLQLRFACEDPQKQVLASNQGILCELVRPSSLREVELECVEDGLCYNVPDRNTGTLHSWSDECSKARKPSSPNFRKPHLHRDCHGGLSCELVGAPEFISGYS